MNDMTTDERQASLWLLEAARGHEPAFEELYRATRQRVRQWIRQWVRADDLDEVMADTFLQVWRRRGDFDPARGHALAWLHVIARTRALDFARRRGRRLDHGTEAWLDVDRSECGDVIDDRSAADPCDLLEKRQLARQLHVALRGLDPRTRWVLGLNYFGDRSHGQISDETGLPLGTVKALIHRARQHLRHDLERSARVSVAARRAA